ncbi:MAG: toprim domain-containing protein, partial [Synergistales bacterium]|nr:toprim domain-containing protein [Synergistales bacterium]
MAKKTLVIVESPTKAKTLSKLLGRNYEIKASMGHVRDLPKSRMGVLVEEDFSPEYILVRGKGSIVKELKGRAKAADRILLASDPDREGEAIAWHLAFLLGLDPSEACRIRLYEITKQGVRNAVAHPEPIDLRRVDAQQARRVLDRLVGYRLSPLLWNKIRSGLSAGRVQSVALRILCEREKEIEAFREQEYWLV